MARVRIVGGAAVGASTTAGLETSTIGTQARNGDTAAGWALRWFLLATLFLVFFGLIASRRA